MLPVTWGFSVQASGSDDEGADIEVPNAEKHKVDVGDNAEHTIEEVPMAKVEPDSAAKAPAEAGDQTETKSKVQFGLK